MAEAAASPNKVGVRPQEDVDAKDILRILEKHGEERGRLIAVLEEIQAEYGHLPEKALRTVSDKTGCSLVDIYGVATFYCSFSLKPRGKRLISVCLGTACHVRGAPRVVEEFRRQLGIQAGETTADREFTLETVNCLGACALGPTVVVDGRYFPNVSRGKVMGILNRARQGLDEVEIKPDEGTFPIEVNCPYCNHSLMHRDHLVDGLPSIAVTVSFGGGEWRLDLSSLYGSHNAVCQAEIPERTVVDLLCPSCGGQLASEWNCTECGGAMAAMVLHEGATLFVCNRLGCKGRRLDLNAPDVLGR